MRAVLILPLAVLAAAPVAAKPPLAVPEPDGTRVRVDAGTGGVSTAPARDDKSPGRMICREKTDLGTRLPSGTTCRTRAQLAQRRDNDRELLDGALSKQTITRSE